MSNCGFASVFPPPLPPHTRILQSSSSSSFLLPLLFLFFSFSNSSSLPPPPSFTLSSSSFSPTFLLRFFLLLLLPILVLPLFCYLSLLLLLFLFPYPPQSQALPSDGFPSWRPSALPRTWPPSLPVAGKLASMGSSPEHSTCSFLAGPNCLLTRATRASSASNSAPFCASRLFSLPMRVVCLVRLPKSCLEKANDRQRRCVWREMTIA